VSVYFHTSELLYSLIGFVTAQVAAVGDMGDAKVLRPALDTTPEVVLVDAVPVNPRPRPSPSESR